MIAGRNYRAARCGTEDRRSTDDRLDVPAFSHRTPAAPELWKVDKTRAAELVIDHPNRPAPCPRSLPKRSRSAQTAPASVLVPEGSEKGFAKCAHINLKPVLEGRNE